MQNDEPPPLAEVVRFVANSLTREYRRTCIRFYTERYGESYGNAVKREVEKVFAKRKGKKYGLEA